MLCSDALRPVRFDIAHSNQGTKIFRVFRMLGANMTNTDDSDL
jgi:hypothetical protein